MAVVLTDAGDIIFTVSPKKTDTDNAIRMAGQKICLETLKRQDPKTSTSLSEPATSRSWPASPAYGSSTTTRLSRGTISLRSRTRPTTIGRLFTFTKRSLAEKRTLTLPEFLVAVIMIPAITGFPFVRHCALRTGRWEC